MFTHTYSQEIVKIQNEIFLKYRQINQSQFREYLKKCMKINRVINLQYII